MQRSLQGLLAPHGSAQGADVQKGTEPCEASWTGGCTALFARVLKAYSEPRSALVEILVEILKIYVSRENNLELLIFCNTIKIPQMVGAMDGDTHEIGTFKSCARADRGRLNGHLDCRGGSRGVRVRLCRPRVRVRLHQLS